MIRRCVRVRVLYDLGKIPLTHVMTVLYVHGHRVTRVVRVVEYGSCVRARLRSRMCVCVRARARRDKSPQGYKSDLHLYGL